MTPSSRDRRRPTTHQEAQPDVGPSEAEGVLVDYQNTTTWPTWAERPRSEIGVQGRLFEVLKVNEADCSVSINFGCFMFWTMPEVESILAQVRLLGPTHHDHHGFEHFTRLDDDAKELLGLPEIGCINSSTLEERESDFTVLRDSSGNAWFLVSQVPHRPELREQREGQIPV